MVWPGERGLQACGGAPHPGGPGRPAQSQVWAPSQAAIHWLLASVQHLEHQVVRLGWQASWEPPALCSRTPGPAIARHSLPTPNPASWYLLPGTRGRNTPEVSGKLWISQRHQGAALVCHILRRAASPHGRDHFRGACGDFLDLRRGENCSPGPMYGGGSGGPPAPSRGR